MSILKRNTHENTQSAKRLGFTLLWPGTLVLMACSSDVQQSTWKSVSDIRSYLIHHPTVFSVLIIGMLSLVILIVFVLIPMRMASKKIKRKHAQQLDHWKKLRQLVQYEMQTYTWHLNKGLIHFQKDFAKSHKLPELASARKLALRIHPTYKDQWEQMLKSFDETGFHKVRLLINTEMSPKAKTESWHYFDIIYEVTPETHESKTMRGVVREAESEEKDSKKLKACYDEIWRTEAKEQHLMSITPQLVSGLNEIMEMSEMFMNEEQENASAVKPATVTETGVEDGEGKKGRATLNYKIDSLQKMLNKVM